MFKQAFQQYKKKNPPPDLQDVIDVDLYEENKITSHSWHNLVKPVHISESAFIQSEARLRQAVGLQPEHLWRCYQLSNHPGLLLIRNPFTLSGQRYWIARGLRDYSQPPYVSNLDATKFSPAALSNWWQELQNCSNNGDVKLASRLKVAMRWTTLGYHHNWDTKVYDEAMHSTFPSDLASLCEAFCVTLGYTNFVPQAAIVNYYPIGTCLSGHTDHSELNHSAPLFSYSFGQSAIFLIGGTTLNEKPSAIYLRSGDVLVMSEASRLCYHAVPRVMTTDQEPWNIVESKANTSKENNDVGNMDTNLNNALDSKLFEKVKDELFWQPFNEFIHESRINMNVRQVLPMGMHQIPT
ncbi:nucleic acid dioxygenase ALKBH1 [Drosophila nasuta]|uniref:nucleic acid dioxygenase ALKBH1 n=1 Tax=Drosophila nasuta TaxID=42062 RepID=UPI00295EDD60|nr:nucleic acid dioxygenase ALKBH1 [Drosophila nasuta]